MRTQTSGINDASERLFKRFPIGCPLSLVMVGGALLAAELLAARAHGPASLYGLPVAGLLLLVGILVLPFGIYRRVRRRVHPIVLICPKCGIESRYAVQPFEVKRWPDVDYAFVVCSHCGKDFTVPGDARLL